MTKKQRAIVCGLCGVEKNVWADDWTKAKFAVRSGWTLDDGYGMLCAECVAQVAEERRMVDSIRRSLDRAKNDNTAYFIAPDGTAVSHIYIARDGQMAQCLNAEHLMRLIEKYTLTTLFEGVPS